MTTCGFTLRGARDAKGSGIEALAPRIIPLSKLHVIYNNALWVTYHFDTDYQWV